MQIIIPPNDMYNQLIIYQMPKTSIHMYMLVLLATRSVSNIQETHVKK
jgi:hypothetical protein